jgi:hypothetical protein
MKPKDFPGRRQRRQYEAALRKRKRDSSRTEKESLATERAIERGPGK